jgi:type II secretory pathway component PulK
VDEESRIGLNSFATRSQTAVLQEEAAAMQLYGLMSGLDNDQWFHDRNLDRWELIGNVADWVDVDTMRSGPRGGYEDDLYNRLDPPYLSKNASFESLQEVQVVEGWADEVYDRFNESLTVWANGKINVNTAERAVLFGLLKAYLTPTPSDDFVNQLLEMLDEYKLLTSFQNASSFVSYLENQGASVSEDMEKAITTSSSVFRITSSGVVGDAVVTITAILDYTSSDTGKVAYWRMD